MSKKQGKKIKHDGVLNLTHGISIPCYVLEDGTRVISGRGMQNALKIGELGDKKEEQKSGSVLPRFFNSKWFNNLIVSGIELEHFQPIICYKGQQKINGYEATVLVDLCDIILAARSSGVNFSDKQNTIADQCEILVRAFAKVGIIALVDEATGYQNDIERAKNALEQILNKFLLQEKAAVWMPTFPDEFFEIIFNLNGWTWNNFTKNRKPSVIGHFINDYVYSRLAPGILEELRRKNPVKPETGSRSKKHHQWLTPDFGHPKLKDHFRALELIYKLSGSNKAKFEEMLDTAYPKFGRTLKLRFPDDKFEDVEETNDSPKTTMDKTLKGMLSVPPMKKEDETNEGAE
jgi:hypothetical protein